MPSWPASCAAGCATSRSSAAAPTPMPAARSSSRATAARRRCRAGSSCSTSSPTARATRAAARGRRRSSTCTARRRGCATGPSSPCSPSTIASQFEELARAHGARRRRASPRFKRWSPRRAPRRAARDGAARRRLRRDPRRPLRRGRAAGADRRRGLDRAAGRAARIAAARVRGRRRRSRWRCATWPTRARRQVPGLLSSRRRRDAAARAAGSGCGALQAACVATDRELLIEVIPPRELASDDDTLARALDADLRRRRPPRLVEAAAAATAAPPGTRIDAGDRAATIRTAAASCCSAWRRARTTLRARASRVAAPHADLHAASPSAARSSRDAAAAWFAGAIGDDAVVDDVAARYARLIDALARARAPPTRPAASRTALSATEGQRMTPTQIGFIGIGMMGHGMAKNLLAKGYPLTLQGATATARASPTCSPPARREAKTPRRGRARRRHRLHLRLRLAAGRGHRLRRGRPARRRARDGLIVVDTSTAEPSSTRADPRRPRRARHALHRRAAGAHAEGSRGRPPQHHGRRRRRPTSRRIKPVLQAFCENVFHVGPPGDGHVLKLVNNMLAMTIAASIAEAVAVAAKSGPAARQAATRWSRPAASTRGIFQMMVGRMLRGRPRRAEVRDRQRRRRTCATTPTSPRSLPVPSFVGEAAHQSFVQAVNLGLGDKFIASLFEAQEQATAKVAHRSTNAGDKP